MADTNYLPAWKPPFLAPEKIRLFNSLCMRPSPWHITFGTGDMLVEPLFEDIEFSTACTLEMTLGNAVWYMTLSDTAMLMRYPALTEDNPISSAESAHFPDEKQLPEDVRQALLYALLEPVLTDLEKALDNPVSLKNIFFSPDASFPSNSWSLNFKIFFSACGILPELTVFCRLFPSTAEAALNLADLTKKFPHRRDAFPQSLLDSVPLEVAFESGYVFLNINDAASLAAEDVLLPEVWTAPDQLTLRIRKNSSESLAALCTWKDGNAVLSSPLSDERDPSMDNTEPTDIDIRLSFELDRRVITMGELQSLVPGYTFVLKADEHAPVTIRANGKALAKGRLVDIDGTLGIQIADILQR
jgi:type III secretion protein Q